jgi:hypothetical protein
MFDRMTTSRRLDLTDTVSRPTLQRNHITEHILYQTFPPRTLVSDKTEETFVVPLQRQFLQ